MLTYSLSKREKALVLLLALVLVFIAWFVLVFQRTSDEISSLDSQIADAESEIVIDQARAAQIGSMKEAIEAHVAAGEQAVEVPEYDNMTPLMGELNSVLAAADTYSISFDDVDVDSAAGYVRRGAKIEFGCDSYGAAESLVNVLANGRFPCSIDSVSITDNTAGTSRSTGSNVSTTLHLTYLEKR